MNQGCWSYVEPRINNLLKMTKFKNERTNYSGRNPSSASATGHHHSHDKELQSLVADSFNNKV